MTISALVNARKAPIRMAALSAAPDGHPLAGRGGGG